MPAYNADKFISEAINSVVNQTWKNWELLVINDGSTDSTEDLILSFKDKRIKYFKQANKGVSAARNVGLANMTGEYFCFLDADDVFPPESLKSRMSIFKQCPLVIFVDGRVEERTEDLGETIRIYSPHFKGNPLKELIKISSSCFLGQTWMIKRDKKRNYSMPTDQSHGEDLFFFAELSRRGGEYWYSRETILFYRRRKTSAMSDLRGLDDSYLKIFHKIKKWPELNNFDCLYFWLKSRKIMFLSYYFDGRNPIQAFYSLLKY